jgi:hypothetical protein
LISTLTPIHAAPGRFNVRAQVFVAALLWLGFGGGLAFAQAPTVEESGAAERAAQPEVNDKAFDCEAFRQLIGAAQQGFVAQRATATRDDETIAAYGVTSPLFGACEIIAKKKIGETSFSCQADTLNLADLKATVEACLGKGAVGYASNENPNTPFLRYDANVGAARARLMVLKTFGKLTLAIFNPK